MKNLFLFVTIVFCVATGCHLLPSTGSVLMDVPDIIAEDAGSLVAEDTIALDGPTDKPGVFIIPPVLVHPLYFYPPGPYAVEKFQVMPNMTFYDPWEDKWIELKDYYLSEDVKALFIVSSAGWCGPCFAEAASLANVYEKYNSDGLEIIYTLGNTNIPGDVLKIYGKLETLGGIRSRPTYQLSYVCRPKKRIFTICSKSRVAIFYVDNNKGYGYTASRRGILVRVSRK